MIAQESLLQESAIRWEERTQNRLKNHKGIEENKIHEIESQERIQKRIKHLTEIAPKKTRPETVSLSQGIIQDIGLERVIGTDDFLDISFLEQGLAVSRSVCKVNIFRSAGNFSGSGTGFMVAPNLVMTNNHVLPNSEIASFSILEFDYQLDKVGNIQPSVFFSLQPSDFFVTSVEFDYTIVAVNSISKNNINLSDYGWNKLMGEGKALIGDPLNIIQHPNGGYKQIVLQSNKLIDLLPIHAHYLTDTEPGSSGSLVCNNQWEVVALHHAGVPRIENGAIIDVNGTIWDGQNTDDIDWVANEGVRISRILQHLESEDIAPEWEEKRQALFEAVPPDPVALYDKCKIHDHHDTAMNLGTKNMQMSWDIPLKITVSLGDIIQNASGHSPKIKTSYAGQDATPSSVHIASNLVEKKVVPYMDPDYTTRKGYDPNYLGIKVEAPKITDLSKVSKMDDGEHLIPYHHFSLVMNKKRRLAYYCASNVDASVKSKKPENGKKYTRKALGGLGDNDMEAWLTDPRIPESHQLPDKFYNKDRKSFDKGHIIRRDDVAWGSTYEEVRISNGDTFHATNCSPQVSNYNRSNLGGIWGKFENHILREAVDEKLVVFSGPLYRKNDRFFEGFDDRGRIRVKIPRAYWKIVVCRVDSKLKTFAFLFRQSLKNVDWDEVFATPVEFEKYQCKVTTLEGELENIKFPKALKDSDQMK